jgi:polygalacturonase
LGENLENIAITGNGWIIGSGLQRIGRETPGLGNKAIALKFCRGLALETVDGALLEDITVTNITMRDCMASPFFTRLGARLRGPEGSVPGKARRINIELKLKNEDFRPAFILDDVRGASFINIKADHAENVPTFVLKNVIDFKTLQCSKLPDKKIDKTVLTKF